MDATARLRAVQLRRLLGLPSTAHDDDIRVAAASRPAVLGLALAAEAADSDDVIGADSAALYLETRLHELAGLIPDAAIPAVRSAFAGRTADW